MSQSSRKSNNKENNSRKATNNKSNNANGQKQQFNKYIKYTNIGIQMLVIIGLGVWGGIKLDEKLNTSQPLFTIFLSLFSVVAAIVIVIRSVLKDQ